MRHAAAACLASLLLGGCAAVGSEEGSGPITLSPQAQAAYAKYRSLPTPLAFAVSTDGTAYGARYCPGGTCRGNEVNEALQDCRRSGKTCYLYDRQGRIVWHGADTAKLAATTSAVTPAGSATAAPSATAAATELPTVARGVLAADIDYEQPSASFAVDPAQELLDQQCRQAGHQHCGDRMLPKDQRRVFVRGIDSKVYAVFSLSGLAPGGSYELVCQLFDPSGGLDATIRSVVTVPANAEHAIARSFERHFALDPAAPLGRWAVTLTVNGTTMSELRFDVVDRPGA